MIARREKNIEVSKNYFIRGLDKLKTFERILYRRSQFVCNIIIVL